MGCGRAVRRARGVARRAATARRCAGEWIVFDQVERVRSVALHSDLLRDPNRPAGPVRRLTRDARAADPDLSPDGRQIVCTVQAIGRRALALLDFAASDRARPRVIVDDPEARLHRSALVAGRPADRRRAPARRRHELVVIDPATRARPDSGRARRRAARHARRGRLTACRSCSRQHPPRRAPSTCSPLDVATGATLASDRHRRRRAVSGTVAGWHADLCRLYRRRVRSVLGAARSFRLGEAGRSSCENREARRPTDQNQNRRTPRT